MEKRTAHEKLKIPADHSQSRGCNPRQDLLHLKPGERQIYLGLVCKLQKLKTTYGIETVLDLATTGVSPDYPIALTEVE